MTEETQAEDAAAGLGGGAAEHRPSPPRWLTPVRDRVLAFPAGHLTWRFFIAVAGLVVVGVGIVLLPLPGPGWAIIFLGLAIWATEFHWASRLLRFARGKVREWTDWLRRQSRVVHALVGAVSLAFLGAGIWFVVWV